jgi:hypothetical protein
MGLSFRFWNPRQFLGIFDLMLLSNPTRGRMRRGLVAGVALRAEQVVETLLLAAGNVEGLAGFSFAQQGFNLAPLGAFFEIRMAEFGGLLLDRGNALTEEGGGAASGFRLNQSRDAVGGRTGTRTVRDRFPAPALACVRGVKRGPHTMQCSRGRIECGAALFLFERAQMKKAQETRVGGHG